MLKNSLLTFILLVAAVYSRAQTYRADTVPARDSIYLKAEKMPQFPGEPMAMQRFLERNVHLPAEYVRSGANCRSLISMVVNADGTLSNIEVVKDCGLGTKEEALRVIKLMPLWIPGENQGNPVSVRLRIGIPFNTE